MEARALLQRRQPTASQEARAAEAAVVEELDQSYAARIRVRGRLAEAGD